MIQKRKMRAGGVALSWGLALLVPLFWAAGLSAEAKEIEVLQLRSFMRKNPGTQLIDVRETEERRRGKIPRSKHIPLGQVSSSRDELNMDKPIITYCRSGRRSQTAAEILDKMGFKEVYNLKGGIKAYSVEGEHFDSSRINSIVTILSV